jgi:dihydroneopterin aldolase
MTDTVYVRGIEFQASHGYTAAERKQTRRFRCDIELERDLSLPAKSDRLADTIDYRALCALIVELGQAKTYRLIEALAGAIVAAVQERYPDAGVTVVVEKIAPPCEGTPEVSGVRLVRPPRRAR